MYKCRFSMKVLYCGVLFLPHENQFIKNVKIEIAKHHMSEVISSNLVISKDDKSCTSSYVRWEECPYFQANIVYSKGWFSANCRDVSTLRPSINVWLYVFINRRERY